jgi:hypothetical protein
MRWSYYLLGIVLLVGLVGANQYWNVAVSSVDNFWNITGSKYLVNNSGILDVDESVLNATIDAREVDTFWNISGSKYLFNDSNILEVNETLLNVTITSISSVSVEYFVGSNLTGSDREKNRVLVLSKVPFSVSVDGWEYFLNTDYTLSGFNVSFIERIVDTQNIKVVYQ